MISVTKNLRRTSVTKSLQWGTRIGIKTNIPKEVAILFSMTRCTSCGNQYLGKCLARTDSCLVCVTKGHKMRDFPKIKSKGKVVNQYPQGGLYPNAP